MRTLLITVVAALALTLLPESSQAQNVRVVHTVRPNVVKVAPVRTIKAKPGYVWVETHKVYDRRTHSVVWVPGHWEKLQPKKNAVVVKRKVVALPHG